MIIFYVILSIITYLLLSSFTGLIFLKSTTPFTPREAYTVGLFWPIILPAIITAFIIGQIGFLIVGLVYNKEKI